MPEQFGSPEVPQKPISEEHEVPNAPPWEIELDHLSKDAEAKFADILAEADSSKAHHDALQKALDSLGLLHQELITDLFDIAQRFMASKIEAADNLATNEELEAEFQKNPKVQIDLRADGLTTLSDPSIDEEALKASLLKQALAQLNGRAILQRPEHRAFQKELESIIEELQSGLSATFYNVSVEIDPAKNNPAEAVKTQLKESALKSKEVYGRALHKLRDLFFNR